MDHLTQACDLALAFELSAMAVRLAEKYPRWRVEWRGDIYYEMDTAAFWLAFACKDWSEQLTQGCQVQRHEASGQVAVRRPANSGVVDNGTLAERLSCLFALRDHALLHVQMPFHFFQEETARFCTWLGTPCPKSVQSEPRAAASVDLTVQFGQG